MFVEDRVTGEKVWFADLKRRYSTLNLEFSNDQGSSGMNVFLLEIAEHDIVAFLDLHSMQKWLFQHSKCTPSRALQSCVQWLQKAISKHGLQSSHLRKSSRTSVPVDSRHSDQDSPDPYRFPQVSCSVRHVLSCLHTSLVTMTSMFHGSWRSCMVSFSICLLVSATSVLTWCWVTAPPSWR